MRAIKTILACVCTFCSLCYLYGLTRPDKFDASYMIAGMLLFGIPGLLLFLSNKGAARRRRAKEERRRANATRIEAGRAEIGSTRNTDKLQGALIGATLLHVLAAPFIIIAHLLKMQK